LKEWRASEGIAERWRFLFWRVFFTRTGSHFAGKRYGISLLTVFGRVIP
jgi:hypothetical protein